MLVEQSVKRRAVEFADGEIGRVGEIDDDEIELFIVLFQPFQRVGVDHLELGRLEGVFIELAQGRRGGKQPGHGRIEIDQRDRFDLRVFEHLARRQPVTTAKDQHPPRTG